VVVVLLPAVRSSATVSADAVEPTWPRVKSVAAPSATLVVATLSVTEALLATVQV
jgi:hypothetical protein